MTNSQPASYFRAAINHLFFALLLLMSSTVLVHAEIVINEFMASNDLTTTDENGDADDWVELFNTGSSTIDIGGWFMSDDLAEPNLSQIPVGTADTIIPAGGFLILWFDKQPEQWPLHINAKLGAGGEDIVLFDGNQIVDSLSYSEQSTDVSTGRIPDGTGDFVFQGLATPGNFNDQTPPSGDVEDVAFTPAGGLYSGTVNLQMVTTTNGASIYYTTDGSEPDEDAIAYTGPINLSDTTAIRARAFANGMNASKVSTNTYLIDVNHDFMIISTSTDPELLYDEDNGMFVLFEEDIEINANLEIFETDGSQVINQMVETEIQGTATANYAQKSLAYKAKSSLGDEDFSYAFFANKDQDSYRSLTGRNSGQDWNMTMFRDAMVSGFVRDLSDVEGMIRTPNLDLQEYRPAVTYLNGEYYGISNLRERIDRRYIEANFGFDRDSIDLLENENEIKEGDLVAWNSLLEFIRNNDLNQADNFVQLADLIDIDNFMDYNVFNVIIDNSDWPGNNTRRWRERSADGKWRWLVYDLDFTFGLHVAGSEWASGNPTSNSLQRLMTNNGWEHPAQDWATELFRAVMTNNDFRDAFINRLADQMNVLFTKERMLESLDNYYNLYTTGANERQQHSDLYTDGWNGRIDKTVDSMRIFIEGDGGEFPSGRVSNVIDHVVAQFAHIDAATNLTFNSNPANAGTISVNSVTLNSNIQPWMGTYYNNVTIPVNASSNRGYFFSGWSEPSMTDSADSSFTPSDNTGSTITANFIQGSVSTAAIVINEINYNSADNSDSGDWVELYNPGTEAVDISGWYFEDESDDFFGLPQNTIIPAGGYLVLVADSSLFTSIYPGAANFIGDFGADPGGFGLSGKGEHVYLYNAARQLIDDVDFDDKDPWPEGADGNGETLQLTSANLDNSLSSSWFGALGTAGKSNLVNTGPTQTISFAPITDKTMLDGSFNVNATANSGLPVSYNISSGQASISGNTITLSGTGTVTVVATQQGNASFDPATPVSQSFNVSLAQNEISFAALANRVETEASFMLTASSSSGLPVTYAIVSGPASLFGNTVTLLNTGTVIIEASQPGNSLYAQANPVQQSFTVTPAIIGPVSYCEAKAEQPWNAWITDVTLNNLVHSSWKDQYGDYTNETVSLTKGSVAAFKLTTTLSWISETLHYKVWIDYNHNGVFEEGIEMALYTINPQTVFSTPTDLVMKNILVPATATSGNTRMRISMAWNEEPTPCGNHDRGEVNDFTVDIQ